MDCNLASLKQASLHVLKRLRTSFMRSLPTMVQLLQRDTRSSTGTLRSSQITPFRQPVSRRRMVIARVSTLAMPAATPALIAGRLEKSVRKLKWMHTRMYKSANV